MEKVNLISETMLISTLWTRSHEHFIANVDMAAVVAHRDYLVPKRPRDQEPIQDAPPRQHCRLLFGTRR